MTLFQRWRQLRGEVVRTLHREGFKRKEIARVMHLSESIVYQDLRPFSTTAWGGGLRTPAVEESPRIAKKGSVEGPSSPGNAPSSPGDGSGPPGASEGPATPR